VVCKLEPAETCKFLHLEPPRTRVTLIPEFSDEGNSSDPAIKMTLKSPATVTPNPPALSPTCRGFSSKDTTGLVTIVELPLPDHW
jgi:hypothetical protein